MTIRRFFVPKEYISGNDIVVSGDEHNHLKNVLRMQVGDEIVVVCNDDWDYYATITQVGKSATMCLLTKKVKNEYNPRVYVTVYQALTKKDAMGNLVQRLSELGVSQFVPFVSENITAKDKESKTEKLQLIANQSVKQCKRSKTLLVEKTQSFAEMLQSLKCYDVVLFANELETANHFKQIWSPTWNRIACIVGSEGGFTRQECEQIVAHGATSISLGKRILRVETATLALVAIVMHGVGELS